MADGSIMHPEARGYRLVKVVDDIHPMGAVRQNRSDLWKKRPRVLRYRAYRDELRAKMGDFVLPDGGVWLVFRLPMPPSWSMKKVAMMDGTPHRSKPDKDNLEKAFYDALFDDDSHLWDGRVTKLWSSHPRIEVWFDGEK